MWCWYQIISTPCYDDSGGPLINIVTTIQVRIVSWEIYCIDYLPTVFTNVGVFHDWIYNKLDLYLGYDIQWLIYR